MIKIDGKTYRLMGSSPSYVEPLKQISLEVRPTNTLYVFGNATVRVTLTFTSPLLVKDIDVLSRPVTYVTWKIESTDNASHNIQLYFDCGAELAVNKTEQMVTWEQPSVKGLKTAKIGSKDQKYLNKPGDNIRIDWGYVYMSVPENQNPYFSVALRNSLSEGFIKTGKLPQSLVYSEPKKVIDGLLSMAALWDLGKTGTTSVSVWAMVAYDDIYSIRYFESDLQAWWRHKGLTFDDLLITASSDYDRLIKACNSFDNELMADLNSAGGEKYAQMCALVYRQCIAAHKLVADTKVILCFFRKRISVTVVLPQLMSFTPFHLLHYYSVRYLQKQCYGRYLIMPHHHDGNSLLHLTISDNILLQPVRFTEVVKRMKPTRCL